MAAIAWKAQMVFVSSLFNAPYPHIAFLVKTYQREKSQKCHSKISTKNNTQNFV
jgi:hypothetical protein